MRTGYMLLFQNAHEGLADDEMVRREMKIAEKAEELGFDILWSAEHHFDSYSMLPDNFQVLTWLGAKTSTIRLGSAAVILPWNDPLRVVEKISMLDALTGGRFVLGMGRGLARMEYEAFGLPMSEARGRFDEASKMIVEALRTGYIEGKGPYYPQKRTEIRPRPSGSFRDRLYAVAMSPESAPIAADLGACMMFFVQFSIDKHMPGVESYRRRFQESQHTPPPPVHAIDFSYCDEDAGRAEATARKYIAGYYASVLRHYEFLEDYHKKIKGYESYGAAADFLKAMGKEGAADDFVAQQAWGTPRQILEKLEARRSVLGDFEWNVCTSYGGLPFERVEASTRLLSKKVLPEVKSWGEDAFETARKSA
jgi:alkanesulfonate monooxygenase SsuD/methylene tetrahydromethanopterin reductase-like flavin-dependent oxidoreductase (luciferase family)